MEKLRDPHHWAAAAPLICAVHCAATPLLVVFLPALALTAGAEGWLLGLSALLALGSLRTGIRVHGRLEVLVPVVLGLAIWGASLLEWLHPVPEPVGSSLGAFMMAGGIFWSARLRHRVGCSECELHGPGRPRHAGAVGRDRAY